MLSIELPEAPFDSSDSDLSAEWEFIPRELGVPILKRNGSSAVVLETRRQRVDWSHMYEMLCNRPRRRIQWISDALQKLNREQWTQTNKSLAPGGATNTRTVQCTEQQFMNSALPLAAWIPKSTAA